MRGEFTVFCSCGQSLHHAPILDAVAFLGGHRLATLLRADEYDRLVGEVVDGAERAVAA